MYNSKLIGRTKECERLERCLRSDSAQFVIVYGRRRVGKTFLINQFFHNEFAFKLTGAYEQPKALQLRNFSNELKRKNSILQPVPKDWVQAFDQLRDYLSLLDHHEKHVLFFDEMPWLDTKKSGFLSAFEWFWNSWASTQDHLMIIVCGSATSWMTDHLTSNKGGLFNRQTCRLYLEPFTLHETEQYLISREIDWSRYDITECYMILGGIPYYLSLLDPELTYSQNIDNLFFKKHAELWDEFDHLYHTLFSNGDVYIKIAEALSSKRGGMTRAEISAASRYPLNGCLSRILENLQSSGFIRTSTFYGKKKRDTLYQLSDYYTWFYFRFIKDNYGKDEHFWSHTLDNPARRVWAGLTFEQVCKDHIRQIKEKLGISGVLTEESAWFFRSTNTDDPSETGAQIDLLIERRDRVIHICEIKFSLSPYVIDKEYSEKLRRKIDTFRLETNCRHALQLTMITTYGIKKNKYSSLVQGNIVMDDLFIL